MTKCPISALMLAYVLANVAFTTASDNFNTYLYAAHIVFGLICLVAVIVQWFQDQLYTKPAYLLAEATSFPTWAIALSPVCYALSLGPYLYRHSDSLALWFMPLPYVFFMIFVVGTIYHEKTNFSVRT